MAALPRLAQQVNGAPGHHFAAVADEGLENLLEVENLRLPVHQGHHVDAEYRLQAGLGVQVVQHHVAKLAAAQLDDHSQAVLVGLVPQLGDTLDFLFLHQFGDALDQARLVQLVRQLVNDDGVPAALVVADHLGPGAHIDAAAPGAIGLDDARPAVDDGSGGKVGAGDVLHQLVDGQLRVLHQRQATTHHFGEVVGRDIGGHTHGDAGGAVDQQVGYPGGQHMGDALGAVVVVDEIHRFLIQVGQQRVGDFAHAYLCVTHGRGGIAVYGAEVALAVNQHVAHRKRLGHAHNRVIDRGVAVGVVFTDHVPHHPRGLLVSLVPVVAEFIHGVQDPAVNRFQAVPHVRQGAPDDHAHGVIKV